jgi:hypothetical protein
MCERRILEEVTIRWRGGYGYITAWTSEDDGVPVCRLEYLQLDSEGRVDQGAAIRLERLGRMQDCARPAGADWQPSTGHFATDNPRPGEWIAGMPPTTT